MVESGIFRFVLLAAVVAAGLRGNLLMVQANRHRRGIDRTPVGTDVLSADFFTPEGDLYRRRALRWYYASALLIGALVWISM